MRRTKACLTQHCQGRLSLALRFPLSPSASSQRQPRHEGCREFPRVWNVSVRRLCKPGYSDHNSGIYSKWLNFTRIGNNIPSSLHLHLPGKHSYDNKCQDVRAISYNILLYFAHLQQCKKFMWFSQRVWHELVRTNYLFIPRNFVNCLAWIFTDLTMQWKVPSVYPSWIHFRAWLFFPGLFTSSSLITGA